MILATGARPKPFAVPGAARVFTVWDALLEPDRLGRRVALIEADGNCLTIPRSSAADWPERDDCAARAISARESSVLGVKDLDEPSMGLSPIMTAEIGKIIRQINALDVSIILVEQNAMLALTLAGYGYVPETGLVVMQGDARELLQDEGVKKAYLGI